MARTSCLPPPGRRCSASPDFSRKAARPARSCRCCGARRRVRAARDADRALLSHRQPRSFAAVRRARAAARRALSRSPPKLLTQREPPPGHGVGSALFATGALAALALALTFALEKGWLTIALALMVPGAAWIAEKRPLPWLRWLAAIMVAVVVGAHRLGAAHRRQRLGTTPIFNWLLTVTACRRASFWLAGWLLRRRRDDLPARTVDAAAILFTVLLVVLEIRHYVTGGDMYQPSAGLTEIAPLRQCRAWRSTIGLEYVRRRSGSIVHNVGACIVAALTLVAIMLDLVYVADPDLARDPVGAGLHQFDPAWLRHPGRAGDHTRADRPHHAAPALSHCRGHHRDDARAVLSDARSRRLFHGPILAGPTGDAEQYSLFDGVAPVRHRGSGSRLFPALSAGAAIGARRDRSDDRQGVHRRHRRASAASSGRCR